MDQELNFAAMQVHPGNRQRGFTVVELMIIVTIISILAVIAMPAYLEYATRSKVGEAMGFLAEAKTSVTESFYSNGNQWPEDNFEAGLPEADSYAVYEFIDRLVVSAMPVGGVLTSATITVTLDLPNTPAHMKLLQLVPSTNANQEIIWTCAPADSNGVDARFLPASCR